MGFSAKVIVKRMFWPFVNRASPTRVLSALHQARSNAVDNEEAERFGAERFGAQRQK